MYKATEMQKKRRGATTKSSFLNPNLPLAERKDEKLFIRVSGKEKAYLQSMADVRGVTVSKLVMDTMLSLQPTIQ